MRISKNVEPENPNLMIRTRPPTAGPPAPLLAWTKSGFRSLTGPSQVMITCYHRYIITSSGDHKYSADKIGWQAVDLDPPSMDRPPGLAILGPTDTHDVGLRQLSAGGWGFRPLPSRQNVYRVGGERKGKTRQKIWKMCQNRIKEEKSRKIRTFKKNVDIC